MEQFGFKKYKGYDTYAKQQVWKIQCVKKWLEDLKTNKKVSDAEMKENAIQQGMNTLKMSGLKKIRRGETTIEETLRVIL